MNGSDGADEPQTSDPFIEWLNFMFKYTNIYLKNGASLLLNQWFCNKKKGYTSFNSS